MTRQWAPRPTVAAESASCDRPDASSNSTALCPTGNRSPNSKQIIKTFVLHHLRYHPLHCRRRRQLVGC